MTGEYLYDFRLKEAEQEGQLQDRLNFDKSYKLKFGDLPISRASMTGLNKRGFVTMTEVQRCVIPHALAGRDIVAAAKTGSGKTLAYLVPMVERLFRERFTADDGLGGLVIVPTREMAMQVFEVFNSFTDKQETITVGLVMGGKEIGFERMNLSRMNVVIGTPGRLLHHLESTKGFNTDNLKMLVIDEADMMFEMGFETVLNQIVESLPTSRQCILLSATVTPRIHQLVSFRFNQPENIYLTTGKEYSFPEGLKQMSMAVPLHLKLDTLYSFLATHKKSKTIVFWSTCKQVRFSYEALRKFKLGFPLFELQGRQKQNKRMALFYTFQEKRYATLLTTNIAARGLDFPSVDWVIQVDVPEDLPTYVHRVGRTARYHAEGKSLLFVTPEETAFLDQLKDKGVLLQRLQQNPDKLQSIRQSLQSFLTEDVELKYLAQRAFIAYTRFVHNAPDKHVFDQPVIEFRTADPNKKQDKLKEMRRKVKERKAEQKQDKTFNALKDRQNETVLSEHYLSHRHAQPEEDDLLTLKRTIKAHPETLDLGKMKVSKNQMRKVRADGIFGPLNKEVILDDGRIVPLTEYEKEQRVEEKDGRNYREEYTRKMDENREDDELQEQARRKIKQAKRTQRLREIEQDRHGKTAMLASDDDQ
ncbi:unnamed protein product [Arctogadus glacialis]